MLENKWNHLGTGSSLYTKHLIKRQLLLDEVILRHENVNRNTSIATVKAAAHIQWIIVVERIQWEKV